MPPLPDAPNAIKVRWTGLVGGVRWANILYVSYAAGTPTAADLNSHCAAMSTTLGVNYKPLMGPHCTVDLVEMVDVSSRTGNQGSAPGFGAGSRTGNALPNNVACCITKLIARRYRGGHPRLYIPGMVGTDVNGTITWTSTYSNLVKAAFDAIRTGINAQTQPSTGLLTLANVSYWYKPSSSQPSVLRPIPIVEPVTGWRVDPRVDTQRRRLE